MLAEFARLDKPALLVLNMMDVAAGLAYQGMVPFATTFSVFTCLRAVEQVRKLILAVDILLNLALLGYFKYLGLLVEGINAVLGLLRGGSLDVPTITLPIGISFFTFQALSYVVDVYRGQVQPQKKLINVALYISFSPS